ncbi:right-handed parallel beta-helix repeat-containing protein [Mucilaginibacter sp. KACC 22063]|uniref:right-handed parallel beta-helix repeat-containing protein n=1 Tax=Mucilaginibacter sp. KACC 22063 TaxID=3025666 RepID=UPI00236579B7|nr:right-handed parallel beta-helix repeat-containing protein [Mucilaginibacter sp. KACC 22063]WDF57133.1 right-handed parallel beta-helix repeat-containing protein [Mucilaginibacter sp. KACC 22063]
MSKRINTPIFFLIVALSASTTFKTFGSTIESKVANRSLNHVQSIGFNIQNILPKGYVKDASVDYTTYIQAALDKYSNVVFPAFPLLITDKGLSLNSNQNVTFLKGGSLVLQPSGQPNYQMIRIHDVSNVTITGMVLKGDKYTHTTKTGEWGMGVSIRGASSVQINSSTIEQCWGDGIYIAGTAKTPFSDHVVLNDITCNDNRRNAISVISVRDFKINKGLLSNTSGTPPMCGLDLEPNNNSNVLDNIQVNDLITKNNLYGISFYLSPLNGSVPKASNVTITNHQDIGSKTAVQFGSRGANISGQVVIQNASWTDNNLPVKIVNYEPGNGAKVIFKGVKVFQTQNGLKRDVGIGVFNNMRRSLQPGTLGVQIQ